MKKNYSGTQYYANKGLHCTTIFVSRKDDIWLRKEAANADIGRNTIIRMILYHYTKNQEEYETSTDTVLDKKVNVFYDKENHKKIKLEAISRETCMARFLGHIIHQFISNEFEVIPFDKNDRPADLEISLK